MFRSNVRKSHLASSYPSKAKELRSEARLKQVMYVIKKQIPCQNLKYFIFRIVNMKNVLISNS